MGTPSSLFDSPDRLTASEHIRFSEVLSALTFALDLTEAAIPGHSLRSCLLGMRLAEVIGLPHAQCASLYYALQLKDVGCSGNAARMTALVGGDDRLLKGAVKLQDWVRPHHPSLRFARVLWQQTLPAAAVPQRLWRLASLARNQQTNNREMIELRCERGADIIRRLELGAPVAEAVRHLDEHWDGSGYPDRLRGQDIPLLARICSVAQNLDFFAAADGPQRALSVLKARRRTWFDPELVWAAESLANENRLWPFCLPTDSPEETRSAVLARDPGLRSELSNDRLDRVCEVFADVVDAKSPFTFRHSIGVTAVAQELARELGLDAEQRRLVQRAALLHDLGKLGVSNTILDKQGKLTAAEWDCIRQHPGLSGSILRRVPALSGVARLAEEHHERLDGSGYPNRHTDRELSLESRLIALADNYAAMVEQRPYRPAVSPGKVLEELRPEVGRKLDPTCFGALESVAERWPEGLPSAGEHSMRHPCATPHSTLWCGEASPAAT